MKIPNQLHSLRWFFAVKVIASVILILNSTIYPQVKWPTEGENDWNLALDYSNSFMGMSSLYRHGMAYLGEDRVLMFGGKDSGYIVYTWIYHLHSKHWSWLNLVGESPYEGATAPALKNHPDGRESMGMAHLGGNRVLLFGGFRSYGIWFDDTWVYDYDNSENGWINMDPPNKPKARSNPMPWRISVMTRCFYSAV